jgi:hypothetical protein
MAKTSFNPPARGVRATAITRGALIRKARARLTEPIHTGSEGTHVYQGEWPS